MYNFKNNINILFLLKNYEMVTIELCVTINLIINILSVPIHKLAREIKHRTEDTFFLKYTMIELVTRDSMMLDYIWSCCCCC